MNRAKNFIVFTFLLAFAVCASAQENPFPNELKGYEFFGNGKLKDLRFGKSSKEDVRKIFGRSCESKCDYSSEWLISFSYYEDIWTIESRNEKGEKLIYKLDSKNLGKLRSIEIRPKKQISFANVTFPSTFQKLLVNSTSSFYTDKSRIHGDEAFKDSNGLNYEVLNQTIVYNFKREGRKSYNKGDLVSIHYEIQKDVEKDLFILQK